MINYIEQNHPSKLFVYEISRLDRSMVEIITVFQELKTRYNITVLSVSEKERWLNTTDVSIRNLILAIFSWVAERERELLLERTKVGIARARAEGKKFCRPKREINWKEVNNYLQKGVCLADIARILDIPYSTLYLRFKEEQKGLTGVKAL
jgi:DNA invertase Pin-like site-specific DNA recombinase